MKKLYINTGGFDAVFNNFKDSFGGDLLVTANEYKLTIKSKWANGSISGVRFEKEMTYLNFDLTFTQDVNLSIESNPMSPVFFAHCEKGNVMHSFGANGEIKCLKKDQSGIMSNSSSINSVLYFESHKHIQFSLIGMPTNNDHSKSDFADQVRTIFVQNSGNYIYIGTENKKIGNKFKELKTIPQQGTVRYLLMKSILREVLELEIAQHTYNYLTPFVPILNFAAKQLSEIKKLSHLNLSTIAAPVLFLKRNLHPKTLALKPYNQKLAS
ncbi:hypothetical protein HNP37_002897 [Flavobacterium nitrogenifigens]|uniref:Uncharacterized protein n=2 Tax=Flavobacterium TaxID=237 RepID=A0A7W7IYF1_9FLAO|nr:MULTISPECIES: hypothetical protein [Flavobacterium]MBB4802822.1 hypothetical protein [Flavobacterium nitrogenifigens]MBB6387780.1 hypothetical protein [Flavobacterium notoginsengisoli]